MAPMQHEPAAEVAFLVKGMDRDCSYPWNHGQLDGDNIDLMQPNEDSEDGNAWRKNTYTATLVMNGGLHRAFSPYHESQLTYQCPSGRLCLSLRPE